MEKEKRVFYDGRVTLLGTTTFHGRKWYIDFRLREMRNVDNPHDKMTFNEIDGLYCDMLNE